MNCHEGSLSHGKRSTGISDSVDVSSYKFEFGVLILLATPVVDGDPTSEISFFFLSSQNDGIV